MLSPTHPEIGTNCKAFGLKPTFLVNYNSTSDWISLYLACDYGGVDASILFTATMIWLIPNVLANKACSLP